jgi:hypothetical protein
VPATVQAWLLQWSERERYEYEEQGWETHDEL